MWTRIRAVIIEDEPLAAQYLATLLDETCQVEVVGIASDAVAGLAICSEHRPDAVFLDIRLPGTDGVSLATQLTMTPQPPRLVFTTAYAERATEAFRLDAVDYLLKPLDPEQVDEAVKRLATAVRPFEVGRQAVLQSFASEAPGSNGDASELLTVKDVDRDQIRLLTRREITAVLRRERRTWVHTLREEFATYYPLADLVRWLGGSPFIQVGRHAVVNLRAIHEINHYGDRLYRIVLRDRLGTAVKVSRTGATRLAAVLKSNFNGTASG